MNSMIIPKDLSWADWEDIKCEVWQTEKRKKKSKKDPQDVIKNCPVCHKDFVFTVGEQLFFKSRNLKPRTICKECKDIHKSIGTQRPRVSRRKTIDI